MSLLNLLDTIRQDFRYGARVLVREPLLTGVIVLTLGLGIGANAAMFGVIDRLLLRGPEHVRDPERVMRVYISQKDEVMGERTSSGFGYVTYALLRDGARAFERVAAFTPRDLTIGRGQEARQVRTARQPGTSFRCSVCKRFWAASSMNRRTTRRREKTLLY
jgi:hypothetical protein